MLTGRKAKGPGSGHRAVARRAHVSRGGRRPRRPDTARASRSHYRFDDKSDLEGAMTWTRGSIDGGETVDHTDDGDIHITGKIDGGSFAKLTSNHGSIIIDG